MLNFKGKLYTMGPFFTIFFRMRKNGRARVVQRASKTLWPRISLDLQEGRRRRKETDGSPTSRTPPRKAVLEVQAQ